MFAQSSSEIFVGLARLKSDSGFGSSIAGFSPSVWSSGRRVSLANLCCRFCALAALSLLSSSSVSLAALFVDVHSLRSVRCQVTVARRLLPGVRCQASVAGRPLPDVRVWRPLSGFRCWAFVVWVPRIHYALLSRRAAFELFKHHALGQGRWWRCHVRTDWLRNLR